MSFKSQKHSIEQVVNHGFAQQPTRQSGSSSDSRSNDLREVLMARRAVHQDELEQLDEEMRAIEDLRRQKIHSIQDLTQQLNALDDERLVPSGGAAIRNYFDKFDWSDRLREQMKKVFGIDNFRLAQEGVCNANMDGRDIICIMPTGGGKSLTYQLPATLTPGCTLVISPLLSLMRDQILHLRENHIEGLMFTASMSDAEKNEAYARLIGGKDPAKEVKLCYVTPERIGKSKRFMSVVKKMVAANRLARFVIDEAHCVSMQGHDYRPDYQQLANLRGFYPQVPILALSATCPPDVLRDLIAILRLAPPTDGRAAAPYGTVKFTSPLYRKNLHYKVLSKPSSSAQVVSDMVKYILQYHPNETGIVYCLSRADSERIADELDARSQGRIKTGVYHAEINDKEKEELHESWRSGKVKVMCATIAFGLGIDKKDVRFVMHHSVSKSVETFYQESGRAGRDGKAADCILYYRLQDALRTPGSQDLDWERRINGMIRFCLDYQGCRKLVFAKYFSSCDWAEDSTRCGHCDNCTRDPASVIQSDVTPEAKRVLAITRAFHSRKVNVTAAQLAQASRGFGQQVKLLQLAPGDRVTLSLVDTETLITHMLLERFLESFPVDGPYRVQLYVKPGLSRRLDEGQKLVIHFLLPERVVRDRHMKADDRKRQRKGASRPSQRISHGSSATTQRLEDEEDDGDVADYSDEDGEDDVIELENELELSPAKRRRSNHHQSSSSTLVPVSAGTYDVLDDGDGGGDFEWEDDAEWKGNLRGAPAVTHRTLRKSPRKTKTKTSLPSPSISGMNALRDDEVIEISSE